MRAENCVQLAMDFLKKRFDESEYFADKKSEKDYRFEHSVRVANIGKEIAEKEVFTELTDIKFEGKTFMALKNYDKYLSNIYGDYMKLPPKEKQVSHHMFEAYYKED